MYIFCQPLNSAFTYIHTHTPHPLTYHRSIDCGTKRGSEQGRNSKKFVSVLQVKRLCNKRDGRVRTCWTFCAAPPSWLEVILVQVKGVFACAFVLIIQDIFSQYLHKEAQVLYSILSTCLAQNKPYYKYKPTGKTGAQFTGFTGTKVQIRSLEFD